jgi:hypothetical protein
MSKVEMIRNEPGLVSIPLEKAIYCEICRQVSNYSGRRCGLCGSERIVDLISILGGPPDRGPASGAIMFALPAAA